MGREFWLAVVMSVWSARAQQLDVMTTHGPVRGVLGTTANMRIFYDIPYGRLPIDGRFKPPLPPENWEEVHEPTTHTKKCLQMSGDEVIGDEECLVLTVVTPLEPQNAAVLFHVHGGDFQSGSGDLQIYRPDLLIAQDIILVIPNYRLGALGFLCLHNDFSPGNAGLRDLVLALEWVQENIVAFGGDPTRVTISGEGTAGALAGLLALSPQTNNTVHQMISESGSSLSPWLLDRDPEEKATHLAESLGGEIRDLEHVTEILLNENLPTLIRFTHQGGYTFKPCIDKGTENPVLADSPFTLLNTWNRTLAVMMGSASSAGMHETTKQTATTLDQLNVDYYALLPNDLLINDPLTRSNTATMIKEQYFGHAIISPNTLVEYMEYYTDAMFLGPALRAATALALNNVDVYFYEFGYVGNLNYQKTLISSELPGAALGDIIGYVFQQMNIEEEVTEADSRMLTTMTQLWANFIKNSIPTSEHTPPWTRLTGTQRNYLSVVEQPAMGADVHPARIAIWDELYDQYYIDGHNSVAASSPVATIVAISVILPRILNRTS